MESSELTEPFRRLLAAECTPAVVRAIESGGDWRPLWEEVVASGFLDALVGEQAGGAGLALCDVAPLMALVGASAMPLPVAETMIARGMLADAGVAAPIGPIVLATGALATPLARVATHALAGSAEKPELIALENLDATGIARALDAVLPDADARLRPVAAVMRAQLIAGAADRVLEMTVAYANERNQFGKPIGRQQAVQQQLAVLAEHVVAARIAAAMGARGGLSPALADAAIAKHVTSHAALQVATISHAVHGAIGMSEEYDLQLLTRRLHQWRLADGGESYWAEMLGRKRYASPVSSGV